MKSEVGCVARVRAGEREWPFETRAPGSWRAIGLALFCIACAPQQPDGATANAEAPANAAAAAPHVARNADLSLRLAADGIELADRRTGLVRRMTFGAAEAEAHAAIEAAVGGPQEEDHAQSCAIQPNSQLTYAGGFSLAFEGGRFVSWGQGDEGGNLYRLPNIAAGMARAQLQRLGHVRFERPDLDTPMLETFAVGPISGMLIDGRVANFQAGHRACE